MKKSVSMKTLVLLLAVMLLIGGTIGGTLAYLATKSSEVKNTFTPSDITIELTESKPDQNTAKMVPGGTIEKDPKVTVKQGSEPCYLFVKIDAANGVVPKQADETKYNNATDFVAYEVADGWTKLTGEGITDVVYYRTVTNSDTDTTTALTADKEFAILKGNQVTVLSSVTKDMMDSLKAENATKPTLTFTAYAVQKAGFTTAGAAWTEAAKLDDTTT